MRGSDPTSAWRHSWVCQAHGNNALVSGRLLPLPSQCTHLHYAKEDMTYLLSLLMDANRTKEWVECCGLTNEAITTLEASMESLFSFVKEAIHTHTSTSMKSMLPLPRACVGYTSRTLQALESTLIKDSGGLLYVNPPYHVRSRPILKLPNL